MPPFKHGSQTASWSYNYDSAKKKLKGWFNKMSGAKQKAYKDKYDAAMTQSVDEAEKE